MPFFGRGQPSKPKIYKSQRDMQYVPFFLAEETPRNQEISKLQREITSFLVLLLFWQATTLEAKKSASSNGRSQVFCFFGVGHHYFLVFFGGRQPSNPEIYKSQWEIRIFLIFWSGKSLFSCSFWQGTTRNLEIYKSQWEITIVLPFWNVDHIFIAVCFTIRLFFFLLFLAFCLLHSCFFSAHCLLYHHLFLFCVTLSQTWDHYFLALFLALHLTTKESNDIVERLANFARLK